jgi:UDP-N-acetyl-D-mannosaminuronic acid transferase (WecB/TagA/CpsF family)
MKRCECGQAISLLSFYPVCEVCLRDYLADLAHRPGFSITQFQMERQQVRQSTAALARVSAVPQRVRLLGTAVDPVTPAQVLAAIESYVDMGLPRQIVTVNVDFIRIAQEHDQFRRIVNNADLSVADGKPILWAARWTGQELPARITGMDLVLGSAEVAVRRNESIFLLGAAEGIAAKAAWT